jgi:hypothetical protein
MTTMLALKNLVFWLVLGILVPLCCYHFGYVNGYADALAWAKGVRWDTTLTGNEDPAK